MLISPKQIRSARVYLEWSQTDLARHAGVSAGSVIKLEDGDKKTSYATVQQVHKTLMNHGIEFVGTNGVIHNRQEHKIYTGYDAADRLYNDILAVAKEKGGEILAIYPTTEYFAYSLGVTHLANLERLEQLRKYANIRCLLSSAPASSLSITGVQCRTIPQHPRGYWSFLIYKDRVNLVINNKNEGYDTIAVQSLDVALDHSMEFEELWLTAMPYTQRAENG